MSSPDIRGTKNSGTKKPKRHPACPGKDKCQFQGCGCSHNAQNSRFSTDHDETSSDLYEVNGVLDASQQLGAASELVTNVRDGV